MNIRLSLKIDTLKQIVSYCLILVIFSFLISYLDSDKVTLLYESWQAHKLKTMAHFVLLILTFLSFIYGWKLSLDVFGQEINFAQSSFIWLIANVGKYIPGKIFMFAGRMELSKRVGLRRAQSISAMTIEHFFMVIAASPFLIWLLIEVNPPSAVWYYSFIPMSFMVLFVIVIKPQILLFFLNKTLKILKRDPIHFFPSSARMFFLLCVYLFGWLLYGLSGAFLTNSLEIGLSIPVYIIITAFIGSWVIGFLSFITPSGLGVREAALVLMLNSEIQTSQAIILSIVARLTWTIVEIFGVIIGLIILNFIKTDTLSANQRSLK